MKFTLFGYTLSIEKKHIEQQVAIQKKKNGFSSRRWSDEDKEKLQKMVNNEKTFVGMARTIGRTEPSVRSAIARYKIVKQIV